MFSYGTAPFGGVLFMPFRMLYNFNITMNVYKAEPDNLPAKAKAEKYAKILSKTLINTSGGDSAQYG